MSSKGKAKIKRFAPKLHVKKDDKVIVLSGASKGKEGVILRMFPDKQRAIVGGVNMVTKHVTHKEVSSKWKLPYIFQI
jgi:ribosomal protein L24